MRSGVVAGAGVGAGGPACSCVIFGIMGKSKSEDGVCVSLRVGRVGVVGIVVVVRVAATRDSTPPRLAGTTTVAYMVSVLVTTAGVDVVVHGGLTVEDEEVEEVEEVVVMSLPSRSTIE